MMILPQLVSGDTPVDTFPLVLPNGQPQPLTGCTGSNFQLILTERGGAVVEGQGTFAVVEPAEQGVVTYAWDANDSATPGTYQLAVRVTFPGGQVLTFGIVNRATQQIVSA